MIPECPTVRLPRLAPAYPNRKAKKSLFRIPFPSSRELHPKHSTSRLAFHLISVLTAEEKLPYEDIHDTLISTASTLKIFDYSTSLASRAMICL